MKQLLKISLLTSMVWGLSMAYPAQSANHSAEVVALKQAILKQAQAWQGPGDPDYSKQHQLDELVNKLVALSPQKPVSERLPLITGAWQQVWGPYTYRNNSRGVDPQLDPKQIYQVVFSPNYYYNVSPYLDKKGQPKHRSVLLRGEYQLYPQEKNTLRIHFTHLRTTSGAPPEGLEYVQIPKLAETKKLELKTLLPAPLVRLFLGGGALREVYTDEDLRITYGAKKPNAKKTDLYILKRVDVKESSPVD